MLLGMLFAQLTLSLVVVNGVVFLSRFRIGSLPGLSTCNFCYINKNSHTISVDSLEKTNKSTSKAVSE